LSVNLRAIDTHAFDFWLARASIMVVAMLQMLLINSFGIEPHWLAPAVEISLLIPLSAATAWTQANVRNASADHHWANVAKQRKAIRLAALFITALITLLNCASLLHLVTALLSGAKPANGQSLLLDALNLWFTNVIAFTLWYWSIDRGGPATRGITRREVDDFLFPQMSLESEKAWSPGFVDYLFLSFTNATAFSPTDTLPLTPRAKLLMMAQSGISLLTIALVAARAVNILN
jgi:hypothetical protein